ncbi:hypothetical protein ABGB18_19370 [Nonomuraea sp. B12E4]|uniref:rhamnogalacturonan lyase family protein n=1 Tax=Nonomuraea sp. B12E4 TaxID=3153564 RepID=UPI00325EF66E
MTWGLVTPTRVGAQYRVDVARQQTSYNQPAYPRFYLGSDIDWSKVPVPDIRTSRD